jgi:hypothetical protein
MDESALRRALASLDDCGASLHSFLEVATVLVVVGVALEMVFVIWEYLEDLHDFKRGIVHPPDKPSWPLFALGFLGAALVALGVGGELYAESKIATLETCIRKGNDALSLLLSKEAGDARKSAEEAGAAADRAKKVADAADSTAQDVAHKAAKLTDKLEAAETKLTAVDAKRAELEKTLLNLAVCNAPRVLNPSRVRVNGVLKSNTEPLLAFSMESANIEYVPYDAEARRAAANIGNFLQSSGWKNITYTVKDGLDDGVEINPYIASDDSGNAGNEAHLRSGAAADALVDFLHSYNWDAKWGWPLDESGRILNNPAILPPDGVLIKVGLLPAVVFVTPPAEESFDAAMGAYTKEREKAKKQAMAEEAKRREEKLKNLPPDIAMKRRAELEEYDKEMQAIENRFFGPCQPLSQLNPRP